MGNKLEVLTIGGGPVAELMNATLKGKTAGWSVFDDKLEQLRLHGTHLVNGPKVRQGLTPPFYERVILGDGMNFNPENPLSGGFNVYPTSYGGPLSPNIELVDDPLIILAVKSPDNEKSLRQVAPLLARAEDPTILLAQNGFAPEVGITEWLTREGLDHVNVVRSVAMGPVTQKVDGNDKPYLDNNIFALKLGHWDAGEGHDELCRKVAGMFSYIPVEVPGDQFRKEGSEKALVNLINPITVLFANTIGQGLDSYLIRQFYKATAGEGIQCLLKQDVGIDPLHALDIAWLMYNSARPHMASMGNDPMGQYLSGGKLPFPLGTEVGDLSGQVVEWGKEYGVNTFWNSFLLEMISDFTDSYNEIKNQDPSKAVDFGMRFAHRNRWLVGFTEDETYNLSQYGSQLARLDRLFREQFPQDRSSPQSVYLCPHIVDESTELSNLPSLLVASYRALKEEYSERGLLDDSNFELSQEVCTQADACRNLERRACYDLRG